MGRTAARLALRDRLAGTCRSKRRAAACTTPFSLPRGRVTNRIFARQPKPADVRSAHDDRRAGESTAAPFPGTGLGGRAPADRWIGLGRAWRGERRVQGRRWLLREQELRLGWHQELWRLVREQDDIGR